VHRSRDCLLRPLAAAAMKFKFNRTGDHSFRASVWGLDTAYCDFIPHLDSETDFARTDSRSIDGPLQLQPCTAGVKEQC
jgi:hypothetical protein